MAAGEMPAGGRAVSATGLPAVDEPGLPVAAVAAKRSSGSVGLLPVCAIARLGWRLTEAAKGFREWVRWVPVPAAVRVEDIVVPLLELSLEAG